jgi:hypothetical protein
MSGTADHRTTGTADPGGYRLDYGTHASAADGRCAMEWVAHLAGEPHSDQPVCVSLVLRAICIALNDGLEDAPRQRLRPYLAQTIGTAGDGHDPERAWLALDWLIVAFAPGWLDAAGADGPALRLRRLAPVTDERALGDALVALEAARLSARALRTDALPSRWDTVRGTARETAWACGGAAAWAAARLAIGAGAGDRARAAAQAIAADAATAAARAALLRHAPPGRAALKDAVRAALAPTRRALDASAVGLLERMLPIEAVELPAMRRQAVFTTSV